MVRRSFAEAAAASISVQHRPAPGVVLTGVGTMTTTTTQQQQHQHHSRPPPPPQYRRISASQKQSLEAATAQFAQAKLLEATPVDHRAAVDGTLGTYLMAQLQALMQNQQQKQQQHPDDDDDGREALVELVHDHCHVEWPVAKSILDAIVERMQMAEAEAAAAATALATTATVTAALPSRASDHHRNVSPVPPPPPPDPLHFPPLQAATTANTTTTTATPMMMMNNITSAAKRQSATTAAASSALVSGLRSNNNNSSNSNSNTNKKTVDPKNRTVEVEQVVAALFPPTTRPRSRQSSLDETISSRRSSSIDETSPAAAAATATTTTTMTMTMTPPVLTPSPYHQSAYHYSYPSSGAAAPYNNAYQQYQHHQQQPHQQQQPQYQHHQQPQYQQQLFHHHHQQQQQYQQPQPPNYYNNHNICSELLLSMNTELSQEGAILASTIANGDVNLAQYLVECTAADTPICRDLLLNEACYRADCPFSHDPPELHTCVFWFKSYCGKGASCRFLHNFSPRLVQSLPQLVASQQQQQQRPQQQFANPAVYNNPDQRVPVSESSFASIAQQNYAPHKQQFVEAPPTTKHQQQQQQVNNNKSSAKATPIRTIPIPLEIWNVTENRDPAVFAMYNDPLERYAAVQRQNPKDNVMDLHYQSLVSFPIVLETLLDDMLEQHGAIWIVTGTGHSVRRQRTHQKSGGALEAAVMAYLTEHGYSFKRGKDKTGQGGALFVEGYNSAT